MEIPKNGSGESRLTHVKVALMAGSFPAVGPQRVEYCQTSAAIDINDSEAISEALNESFRRLREYYQAQAE